MFVHPNAFGRPRIIYANKKSILAKRNPQLAALPAGMDFDRLIGISASIFGALVACASLTGWLFDIEILKSLWPQGPALKSNGACALAASSCSLMLAVIAQQARVVQACLGLAVSAFGCAVLLEYATGADFGFDNLLFMILTRSSQAAQRSRPLRFSRRSGSRLLS